MRRIFTLAMKDLRLLVRDRASLFFTVAFPLLFGIFFGTIFSGGAGDTAGIPVAVVDLDHSKRSEALLASLKAAKELDITTEAGNPPVALTPDRAADLVRLGRRTAFIIIPEGYGDDDRGMFFGAGAELELGIDPSRQAEAGMLEGVLTRYAFEQFAGVMRDPTATRAELTRARTAMNKASGIDPLRRGLMETMFAGVDGLMADMQKRQADPAGSGGGATPSEDPGFSPVRIKRADVARQRSGPRNSYNISFAQAIMWGVAGCAAAFGLSLVIERSKGTLVRLRTAPLSWAGVLAGKALACFIATATVAVGLLVIARVVFNVVPDSPALLALAIISLCACFVGLMMLLAVLGRSESSAGSIGWAVILVFMMIGGATVPLFFMPKWLQTLSYASPVRWGILALEGAMWRGYSLTEMLLPCGVLIAVGAVSMIVGVRLFKWAEA